MLSISCLWVFCYLLFDLILECFVHRLFLVIDWDSIGGASTRFILIFFRVVKALGFFFKLVIGNHLGARIDTHVPMMNGIGYRKIKRLYRFVIKSDPIFPTLLDCMFLDKGRAPCSVSPRIAVRARV